MSSNFSYLLISLLFWQTISADFHEYRLYEDLSKNYSPLERPVSNSSLPVKVTLSFVLQQLMGMDEKNQVIQVNAWLKFTWKDYKLRWNKEEYGGIANIRFPFGTIWRPDVLLYNSADKSFSSMYESNMVVYHDGTVNWIPPVLLRSSCKVDITWFPFDDQNCKLKFGSWTYHGFALDLQPETTELTQGMDTSEYLENDEWYLLGTPVERQERYYTCCPEPYPSLIFSMKIRRRTLYYGVNLIAPSLLISLMTVLGFILPPDACEKITLEITILLSICVFLKLVTDMTPPTSEVIPLIVVFFSCCMLTVAASVVFTVMVLNLHHRKPDTHHMSRFTRRFLLEWLPRVLMMSRPTDKPPQPSPVLRRRGKEVFDSSIRRVFQFQWPAQLMSAVDQAVKEGHVFYSPHDTHYQRQTEMKHVRDGLMILLLERIHAMLEFITNRMGDADKQKEKRNDWKFAAMVVDRLCLWVFSGFIVASTCGIIFSAPHIVA